MLRTAYGLHSMPPTAQRIKHVLPKGARDESIVEFGLRKVRGYLYEGGHRPTALPSAAPTTCR